jgi:hypothetical protein
MIVPDWAAYHRFRPSFAEAMDPAFYPIDHLDHLLLSKRATLFASGDAAMVAEIRLYPSGLRAVHCLVAAGRIDEIVEAIRPRVEAWGRAHGCGAAIVESRAGWANVLKPHGYAPFQISVRKDL